MSTSDTHLPLERRRNVGALVRALLAQSWHPALAASVRTRGEALAAASDALVDDGTTPRLVDVDRATDAVVTALHRGLADRVRAASDAVIAPPRELRAQHDAAQRVLAAVFPDGVGFVHKTFGLEWDALRGVAAALGRHEVAADLAALGLGPCAAHARAHIALYGRALGSTSRDGAAADAGAHDPWATACGLYIAAVELASEDDPARRTQLLAPVTGERASYLAELRAARARGKKRPAPGPAPTGAPAT